MASYKKHGTGWEYRLRYKDPFTQKFREKAQRGCDSKKEAQLAVREFERKLAAGYEQSDLSLQDYLDFWINEYKKGSVSKNTLLLHQNNQNSRHYGYVYWIFFRVLIETGMRKSEVAALKWIDIDLDNHFITIDETLDFTAKNKEELFGDTKTEKSERKINITTNLVNHIKFHREWQEHNKGILGDRYHHDLDLVLCN